MDKSQRRALLAATAASLILAACASVKAPETASCPVCPVCPTSAPSAPQCPPPAAAAPPAKPMQPARWSDLPGWEDDDLTAALPAFLQSCRALASRPQWPLWRSACEGAKELSGSQTVDSATLHRFFESRLEPYLLTNPDASTSGLITGYYEPLLRGARTRSATFAQPVLGVPPDLLTIDLAAVAPEVKNLRLRGRLEGRRVVPYYSRAEIVGTSGSATDYADEVLLWVDDAVELFFLQIQGSGRVSLPDGSVVRLGYADQNGHPYQSVGRVLIERGELKPEQASMQGIQSWGRENPDKINDVLNANPSYVFFREVAAAANEGPQGALGVPLTAERSVAVDARYVPLGAPIFLSTTRPNSSVPLRRVVFAQDTGGAIRGVVRADFFWGFGAEAGSLAGRMKQTGQMWVLLPPGVAPK
jgi:membrane-bound lytic murein transglycosylase A